MDSLYKKINKWIPSKSDDAKSRSTMVQFYVAILGVDLSSFFEEFSERISRIEYDFVESAITSGAMCFFGSLVMSLTQLGYINNIEELFTFAACYILTDHYLDDNTVVMENKVNTIHQINKFIDMVKNHQNHHNKIRIDSPIIKVVAKNYISMVTKIPSSERYLREVFQAEVKTMYLQTHDNLDRDTYLEISEWKGGLFCNAIQAILELEVTQAEYDLGACIQLVDDILDIEDDMSLGISTIVTHDYKVYGNLDRLLMYTVDRIDNLDRKYNLFKVILCWGLTLSIHNNREKYSKSMIDMMDNFIYYKPTTTKRSLIVWMKEKLVNCK